MEAINGQEVKNCKCGKQYLKRCLHCGHQDKDNTKPPDAEGVKARTAEDYELEIEYWKSRLSDLCDQAWGQVYPGKTDWEYSAQAVRHLMQENDELKAKVKERASTAAILDGLLEELRNEAFASESNDGTSSCMAVDWDTIKQAIAKRKGQV